MDVCNIIRDLGKQNKETQTQNINQHQKHIQKLLIYVNKKVDIHC